MNTESDELSILPNLHPSDGHFWSIFPQMISKTELVLKLLRLVSFPTLSRRDVGVKEPCLALTYTCL